MKSSKIHTLQEILLENNGVIETKILNKNRFTSRDIKWLVHEGFLVRIKAGYYVGKQKDSSDAEIVSKLIPSGVLCLFTAIDYYGLTTVNPTEICVALPRGVSCPTLPADLFVKIYHMTDSHFDAGITEVEINGTMVKMYDVEKTICDCFKYEKDIGKDIALEVLKNYIAKGNCQIQKLLDYATLLGKKKIIYPYLEALI